MDARINILGPVSMTLDGRPVPLTERKQRILLGILALENRRVEMARLVALLWDALPENPNAQVTSYVSRIRSALQTVSAGSEKMLRTSHGVGYQLVTAESAVDYHRFSRGAAKARLALRDDPARSADLGREAVAEWGPLAGIRGGGTPLDAAGESQLDNLVKALRDDYQAALMTWLTAELRCGRHEQMLPVLNHLAGYDQDGAQDPKLTRMRMRATYRSGEKYKALDIYERYVKELKDRLAAEPDEETRKLKNQILSDDPALRPAKTADQPGNEKGPAENPAGSPPASTTTVHQEGHQPIYIDRTTGPVTINNGPERSKLDMLRHDVEHADSSGRTMAAQELAVDRYPEAVPELIRQLFKEDHGEAQFWLIHALGSAGGADAVQALTTFAESTTARNPLIQSAISEALGIAREGGLGLESASGQGGPL